jgi:hypothetical protein
MCNNFNVGTLKGLAAHKRGCARKIGNGSQKENVPELNFKKEITI